MINIDYKNKGNQGIALLMAVLIAGIFFVISSAVYKIALIELVLSSTGRDSQFAFYAADTGAECALYWDRKYNGPDTSGSAFNIYEDGTNPSNRSTLIGNFAAIQCGGGTVAAFCNGSALSDTTCSGGGAGDTMIKINQPANNICAEVWISKIDPSDGTVAGVTDPPPLKTVITSRGYNTCDVNNPRRVERAIKVTVE
jgi:uncharacterized protein (UPF0333 family)